MTNRSRVGKHDTSVTISRVVGRPHRGVALLRNFFGGSTLYVGDLYLPRERRQLTLTARDMRTLARELLYSAEIADIDKGKRQDERRKAKAKMIRVTAVPSTAP